jgi:SAM-dependent methyltransferase
VSTFAANASESASCYVCGARAYRELLRKAEVYIFTDSPDDQGLRHKYACELNQCTACGHVYEPVNQELRGLCSEIYKSVDAQGPAAMGLGQWGVQRAERLFFSSIELDGCESAVEIGCGDGYLLRVLKSKGFKRLIGVEPSINIGRHAADGITFLNDFIDEGLRLDAPVNLAYSVAVFEHIENINGVLVFCRNNLTDDGRLFFVVPNAQWQLETGDPGLFIHQHLHYFTADSVKYLLGRNGFQVTAIEPSAEGLRISARKCAPVTALPAAIKFFDDYQQRLDRSLVRLRELIAAKRVILHGACNALNNVFGWIGGHFELADNDFGKVGKTYFGVRVKSPAELDLAAWDAVVVIATAYFEEIKSDYRARGFRGRIVPLNEG